MILQISFLLFSAASPPQADEMIDRVVATVGQQVVTLSAVRRQLRMEALVNGSTVNDTPEARRRAAERLIDQALIRREIELSRYTPPTMSDIEKRIDDFMRQRAQTPEQFQQTLARYGFTEDDFKQEALYRISLLRFIDFRFAPGIQVSDAEIETYYTQEFLPRLRRVNPQAPTPPLDEVRDSITRILSTSKTNTAMDQWLAQARETQKVRFFEEAFQEAPARIEGGELK